MLRTKDEWEKIYEENRTPWDAREQDPYVVTLVEKGIVRPCKTIDLGCGTGNEAIYLTKRGFQVTGIDISEFAIQEAKRRAAEAGVECEFIASDVLDISLEEKYDFAVDRACFHFLDPEDHEKYLAVLRRISNPGAMFFLVVSSEHETAKGPHQFSKEDIHRIFDRDFEIKSLELVTLETHGEKPRPYLVLLQKG